MSDNKTQVTLTNIWVGSVEATPTKAGTPRVSGSVKQLNSSGNFQTGWFYNCYEKEVAMKLQAALESQEAWELRKETTGGASSLNDKGLWEDRQADKPTVSLTGYFQSTKSKTTEKWFQNFIITSVEVENLPVGAE